MVNSINVGVTLIRSDFYATSSLTLTQSIFHFKKLNSSIIYSTMKFFDDNENVRIINRLSSDINTIDDELTLLLHVFLISFSYSLGLPIGIAI